MMGARGVHLQSEAVVAGEPDIHSPPWLLFQTRLSLLPGAERHLLLKHFRYTCSTYSSSIEESSFDAVFTISVTVP